MAQDVTNTDIKIITGIEIIPTAKVYTGTYTTVGVLVTGVGTKFVTEFLNGVNDGYLYSSGKSQYRKIVTVISDTLLIIDVAFATDVVASESVKVSRPQFESLTANITGASDGGIYTTYSGQDVLKTGQAYEFQSSPYVKLMPYVFNGTGTSIELVIHK